MIISRTRLTPFVRMLTDRSTEPFLRGPGDPDERAHPEVNSLWQTRSDRSKKSNCLYNVSGQRRYLAPEVHAPIAALTQLGIGAVRMRPFLPRRSTMHQRP